MSLVMMEGFDNMTTYADFRAAGWATPAGTGSQLPLLRPSTTGVAGKSLTSITMAVTGVSAGSDSAVLPGVSGATDMGYYDTGLTVAQAYAAGGVSVGCSAKFAHVNTTTGAQDAFQLNKNQITYDSVNSLYYTIRVAPGYTNGAVMTSSDLTNWTITTSQPPSVGAGSATSGGNLTYVGNGTVCYFPTNVLSATLSTFYYTKDSGRTWQTDSGLHTAVGTARTYWLTAAATGNATYPVCITLRTGTANATNGIYVGTPGGTWKQAVSVATGTISTSGASGSDPVVVQRTADSGMIVCYVLGTFYYVLNSASADISTGWVTGTALADTGIFQVRYWPKSNTWLCASSASPYAYSLPNSGTTADPLPPTSTTKTAVATVTVAAYTVNICNNGGSAVFTGGGGVNTASLYIVSTDGVTYTPLPYTVCPNNGVAVASTNVAGQQLTCYSACVGQNGALVKIGSNSGSGYSQFIASSPDGNSGWVTNWANDESGTGTAATVSAFYGSFGLVTSSTGAISSGIAWTFGSRVAGFNANTAAFVPGTTATVNVLWATPNSNAATSVALATTTDTNNFEMVAAADPNNANGFLITYYVNGVVQRTATCAPITGTDRLVLTLPRTKFLTCFDDIYITTQNGTGTVGPLGKWNIRGSNTNADVAANWTRSGTQTTNAASVRKPMSQAVLAADYVTTSADGTKDEYSMTALSGSNYNVLGVKAEAYGIAASGTPQVQVGLKTTAGEVDGTATTMTASSYSRAQVISEVDGAGAKWTQATATAADVTLIKVS